MTIDELVAFVETRAPGFANRIRPTDGARLAKLEKWAGRSLPPLYREYMQRMGRFPAEMFRPNNWNLDADKVLGAIRTAPFPRERFAMFGVDERGAWWERANLYFDRDDDDAVVAFERVDPDRVHPSRQEASFADFLIDRVARLFCISDRTNPIQLSLDIGRSSFANGIERAVAWLVNAGVIPCFTPTRTTWLGQRGDTFAFVRTLAEPGMTFFVYLAGPDAEALSTMFTR